jgi:hypothetical protein
MSCCLSPVRVRSYVLLRILRLHSLHIIPHYRIPLTLPYSVSPHSQPHVRYHYHIGDNTRLDKGHALPRPPPCSAHNTHCTGTPAWHTHYLAPRYTSAHTLSCMLHAALHVIYHAYHHAARTQSIMPTSYCHTYILSCRWHTAYTHRCMRPGHAGPATALHNCK